MSAAVAFALPTYQQVATDKILKSAATDKSLGVGSVQNLLATEAKKQPPRGQLTTWCAVREFMFGGKARFTLQSLKTGMRYTYLVRVKKEDVKAGLVDKAHFISLLRGPNNEADYVYLGVLRRPGSFFITPASRISRHPGSYRALVWMLDQMRNERKGVLGVSMEVWHEGRCSRCGRALTVPKSVNDAAFNGGYGPECVKYFGTTTARQNEV